MTRRTSRLLLALLFGCLLLFVNLFVGPYEAAGVAVLSALMLGNVLLADWVATAARATDAHPAVRLLERVRQALAFEP